MFVVLTLACAAEDPEADRALKVELSEEPACRKEVVLEARPWTR